MNHIDLFLGIMVLILIYYMCFVHVRCKDCTPKLTMIFGQEKDCILGQFVLSHKIEIQGFEKTQINLQTCGADLIVFGKHKHVRCLVAHGTKEKTWLLSL